ncbi:MAG: hypothetical protein PHG27_05785 [Massilibacteroides sp.]|nr:hypothetical protein [Massilibacteroides sp.]MDD3061790.1 hypothetical protein [Massilibacteroides sp.]MDD4115095.1 hypothetical protein [Massilibacteroides sp.]MDD4660072.1 hypothetical protein [Massilibacteroides sp.]
MKQIIIILFFLALGNGLKAQADFTFMLNKEGKLIALPRKDRIELNIPIFFYKSYTPASTRMVDDLLNAYNPVTVSNLDERPMDMQVLSGAYKPFFNEYAPMLRRVSPMAFDFKETELLPINENLTFAVTGQQQTWPGMGGLTSINPALIWQSGAWEIGGGGFAARYYTPFNASPEFVSGVNLHTGFQATDWLKVNMWGQYAGYNNNERKNPHMLLSPYFYHNSVGTSLEFKLNENFGVGTGIQYEFNPMRNKWERQFLLFPIFY